MEYYSTNRATSQEGEKIFFDFFKTGQYIRTGKQKQPVPVYGNRLSNGKQGNGSPGTRRRVLLAEVEAARLVFVDSGEAVASMNKNIVGTVVADARNLSRYAVFHAVDHQSIPPFTPKLVDRARRQADALAGIQFDPAAG